MAKGGNRFWAQILREKMMAHGPAANSSAPASAAGAPQVRRVSQ
jgi:hypothetical protein